MKKLMFAAAALAAGIAVADVTSANIVGYAEATLRDVNETAGAAFVPVTGETIDVTDLVGTGYDPYDMEEDEGGCSGEINLQMTDNRGRTEESYFWNDYQYPDEDNEEIIIVVKGWLDGDDEPVAKGDCTVAPGEGFLLKCKGDGFGLQSSGEVLTDADQPVLLRNVNKLIANPTPVTVDLKNCYVTGYDDYDMETEEGGASGEVNAQKTDERGRTIQSYFWNDYQYPDEDNEEEIITVYGWLDGDDEPIVKGDCTVGTGLGFLIKSKGDGYTFVWPKVDVK